MHTKNQIISEAGDIERVIEREIELLGDLNESNADLKNRECSTIPCAYLGKDNKQGVRRECSTIPCAYLGTK